MRYLIYFCWIISYCYSQYYWPVTNVYTRQCNSTFCEYRYNTNPDFRHFHEGIDIYPVDNSNEVVSTWDGGFEVEDIRSLGNNYGYAVTIQHYNFTVANNETTWIEQPHGSRYLHMHTDPNIHLDKGAKYSDDVPIIENSTFYNNHLHFEIRVPAPIGSDYQNALNPMGVDATLCPDDNDVPILLALYADGSTDQSNHHQGDAVINS